MEIRRFPTETMRFIIKWEEEDKKRIKKRNIFALLLAISGLIFALRWIRL